ncbi:MAG: FecR domain-containing protein [Sulfuritalea sp.]|nr:FecR domain-containing protein [Sulfuritalea sp.]
MTRPCDWPGRRLLCAALVAALFAPPLAAAETIGRVAETSGTVVRIKAAGAPELLGGGSPLATGDVIETQANSGAELRYDDGTVVRLAAASRFTVPEYRLAPQQAGEERFVSRLLAGAMRVVTGTIAKRQPRNARFVAHTATIGIRGTDFTVRMCETECELADSATVARAGQAEFAGRVGGSASDVFAVDARGRVRPLADRHRCAQATSRQRRDRRRRAGAARPDHASPSTRTRAWRSASSVTTRHRRANARIALDWWAARPVCQRPTRETEPRALPLRRRRAVGAGTRHHGGRPAPALPGRQSGARQSPCRSAAGTAEEPDAWHERRSGAAQREGARSPPRWQRPDALLREDRSRRAHRPPAGRVALVCRSGTRHRWQHRMAFRTARRSGRVCRRGQHRGARGDAQRTLRGSGRRGAGAGRPPGVHRRSALSRERR